MQDYPPGGRPAEQKQQRSLLERLTALIAPEPENRAELLELLHDAHECITNDIASPAKPQIGPAWREFEAAHEEALHVFFGLRLHFDAFGPAIRHADLVALATERRDLMHPGGPPWEWLRGIEPLPHVNLRERDGFTWQDWRAAFIDRFQELDFARNELHHLRKPAK